MTFQRDTSHVIVQSGSYIVMKSRAHKRNHFIDKEYHHATEYLLISFLLAKYT